MKFLALVAVLAACGGSKPAPSEPVVGTASADGVAPAADIEPRDDTPPTPMVEGPPSACDDITGFVRAAKDGAAIAGVTIVATGGEGPMTAISGEDGSFTVASRGQTALTLYYGELTVAVAAPPDGCNVGTIKM